MGYRVAAVPLLPVLYVQGRRFRRAVPLLPEPPGDRVGERPVAPVPNDGASNGVEAHAARPSRPLRLLVLGDSAAAGVGAASQDEALLGQLVAALAAGGPVAWRLIARTGATAAGTRRHLERLAPAPGEAYDAAVVSLGVNDVVAGRTPADVLADLTAVVDLLGRRWGVRHVVLTGLPPVGRFPALPQPLRWYLGRRTRALDAALGRWVAARPGCELLRLDASFDVTAMAADGFHPGPALYAAWGQAAAARLHAWHGVVADGDSDGASRAA